MRSRAYEIVHVISGRVRIVVAPHLATLFATHLVALGASSFIKKVTWNGVTRSVVIEYIPDNTELAEVLLALDQIFSTMGDQVGGQDCQHDLFWSLLAGGAIALAFVLRRVAPRSGVASVVETAAFGITGYSVMTHCSGQNSPSRKLHLDSIAGLVSVLNCSSNKAFAGLFMTWLFNFMEIIGLIPLITRQAPGVISRRCGVANF